MSRAGWGSPYVDDLDDTDGELEELAVDLVVLELSALATDDAGLEPVPCSADVIVRLRAAGVKVALVSNLSEPATQAALAAGRWGELVDLVLWPAIAGRARPYPDIPLIAVLRSGVANIANVVLVGGTVADIRSGVAAGLGSVLGVLNGTRDERSLVDAGADAILDSLADLPALLGIVPAGLVPPLPPLSAAITDASPDADEPAHA